MAYYLDGFDKVKFKMSNFVEKLKTEPEFRNYFYSLGEELFRASIRESKNIEIIPEPEVQTEDTIKDEGVTQ